MAENYLITGYWGEPHVTAENDRGINAAIFGTGRFVLPVGERFRAEYIGNNTVRMYDGKLMDNGAAAGIPAGRYVDLTISTAGQGMKRNDLIVFQYSKDASSLVESGVFTVVKGTETTGTAVDPVLTQRDLLSDEATFDQMALWRVPVSGTVISAPVQMFEVYAPIQYALHGITTSGNGAAYTATVEAIKKLSPGECFVMIPHTASTTNAPTLNVNGLGAKTIRQRLSTNPSITVPLSDTGWLASGKPVLVMYNGSQWVVEITRPDASNLYGTTQIANGGTGATTVEGILSNLGISAVTEMVELWKNASPGATFAGQSIKIDTTGYKMLVIALRGSTSATQKYESLTVLNATPNSSHYATAIKTSTAISISYRTVMVYSDELRIGDAYVSESATDNTYAIPVCIWGIK